MFRKSSQLLILRWMTVNQWNTYVTKCEHIYHSRFPKHALYLKIFEFVSISERIFHVTIRRDFHRIDKVFQLCYRKKMNMKWIVDKNATAVNSRINISQGTFFFAFVLNRWVDYNKEKTYVNRVVAFRWYGTWTPWIGLTNWQTHGTKRLTIIRV